MDPLSALRALLEGAGIAPDHLELPPPSASSDLCTRVGAAAGDVAERLLEADRARERLLASASLDRGYLNLRLHRGAFLQRSLASQPPPPPSGAPAADMDGGMHMAATVIVVSEAGPARGDASEQRRLLWARLHCGLLRTARPSRPISLLRWAPDALPPPPADLEFESIFRIECERRECPEATAEVLRALRACPYALEGGYGLELDLEAALEAGALGPPAGLVRPFPRLRLAGPDGAPSHSARLLGLLHSLGPSEAYVYVGQADQLLPPSLGLALKLLSSPARPAAVLCGPARCDAGDAIAAYRAALAFVRGKLSQAGRDDDESAHEAAAASVQLALLSTSPEQPVRVPLWSDAGAAAPEGVMVQYNAARIEEVLRRHAEEVAAGRLPALPPPSECDFSPLADEGEWRLFLSYVALRPAALRAALAPGTPATDPSRAFPGFLRLPLHKAPRELAALARDFSVYYKRVRFLAEHGPGAAGRLHVLCALRASFAGGLALLGLRPAQRL